MLGLTLKSAQHTSKAVVRKGLKDVCITVVLFQDLWAIATCPDQIERYQEIISTIQTFALFALGFVIVESKNLQGWIDAMVERSLQPDSQPIPQPDSQPEYATVSAPMSESMSDSMSDSMSESMSDPVSEPVSEPSIRPASPFTGSARAYELLDRAELFRLCWNRGIRYNKKDPTVRIIRRLESWDKTREAYWKTLDTSVPIE